MKNSLYDLLIIAYDLSLQGHCVTIEISYFPLRTITLMTYDNGVFSYISTNKKEIKNLCLKNYFDLVHKHLLTLDEFLKNKKTHISLCDLFSKYQYSNAIQDFYKNDINFQDYYWSKKTTPILEKILENPSKNLQKKLEI